VTHDVSLNGSKIQGGACSALRHGLQRVQRISGVFQGAAQKTGKNRPLYWLPPEKQALRFPQGQGRQAQGRQGEILF
jgi:hypothetical protein